MLAKRRYTQWPAINALTLRIGYLSKKCAEKNEKANGLATAHSLGLANIFLAHHLSNRERLTKRQ